MIFKKKDQICKACDELRARVQYLEGLVDKLLNAQGIMGVTIPFQSTQERVEEVTPRQREVAHKIENGDAEIFGEG